MWQTIWSPTGNFPGVEKLRELAFSDLDGALRLGLQMTLENLANRALEVSPESREALAYLDQTERKEKKEFRNQCRIYKLGYIKLQGNSESGSESNSRSNSESISLTANL